MQDILATRHTISMPCNLLDPNRSERSNCLVCIHPADRLGQIVELGDCELLVGRDAQCDLDLADDSVSRRHAMIRPAAGGFVVTDLDSTNGTYVNDTRITVHQLEPNDRLRFGNQIFKYLSHDRFEAEYFENAYRMMTTDGLTQAYNKRYLFDVAERELRRSRRSRSPVSVLMIDLDRFKTVNDTYGHLAGDEVLIELGRRLRSTLRGDEVLARYGGEEFCLLLPDTTLAGALEVAERVRLVVANQSFHTERAEVSITVSIGAACVGATEEISAADLIEQADQRLYAAKRAGRNQVVGQ